MKELDNENYGTVRKGSTSVEELNAEYTAYVNELNALQKKYYIRGGE